MIFVMMTGYKDSLFRSNHDGIKYGRGRNDQQVIRNLRAVYQFASLWRDLILSFCLNWSILSTHHHQAVSELSGATSILTLDEAIHKYTALFLSLLRWATLSTPITSPCNAEEST